MGYFSEVLKKLMDQKKISNDEVVHYTGINKSTFYKIKNGMRNPSGLDVVEKIARALRLNEEDRQTLLKTFEIDRIGHYKYFGMEVIRKFFMSDKKPYQSPSVIVTIPEFEENEHVRIFRNVSAVSMAIMGIMFEASSKIRILESRMGEVYKTGIPQAARINPETEFDHIFMLNDSKIVELDHQLYNVNCFRDAMDIIVRTNRYYPRFLYSTMAVYGTNEQQLNFVLSDRYLLTYANGYESAVLFNSQEIIDFYGEIYEELMNQSDRFIETTGVMEFLKNGNLFDTLGSEESYVFFPGICSSLLEGVDDSLIRSYIKDDFPEKEILVRFFEIYRERFRKGLRKQGESVHLISESNSLSTFAHTGYINECPKVIATAVRNEDRAHILGKWEKTIELFNIRGTQDECLADSSYLSVFASCQKVILVVIFEQDTRVVLAGVSEPSIVGLFYGLLERMEKENTMGEEEYRRFIERLIEEVNVGST